MDNTDSPSRAIAIANRDSVTVSMAALTSGILIRMFREMKVLVSTSLGRICDLAAPESHRRRSVLVAALYQASFPRQTF